jgi:regulatory protein YycI of two-component signal transduction system YycFG
MSSISSTAEAKDKEKQQQQSKKSKKKIERARTELKAMLDKPVALSRQGLGARSKGFVVFAK